MPKPIIIFLLLVDSGFNQKTYLRTVIFNFPFKLLNMDSDPDSTSMNLFEVKFQIWNNINKAQV